MANYFDLKRDVIAWFVNFGSFDRVNEVVLRIDDFLDFLIDIILKCDAIMGLIMSSGYKANLSTSDIGDAIIW